MTLFYVRMKYKCCSYIKIHDTLHVFLSIISMSRLPVTLVEQGLISLWGHMRSTPYSIKDAMQGLAMNPETLFRYSNFFSIYVEV